MNTVVVGVDVTVVVVVGVVLGVVDAVLVMEVVGVDVAVVDRVDVGVVVANDHHHLKPYHDCDVHAHHHATNANVWVRRKVRRHDAYCRL